MEILRPEVWIASLVTMICGVLCLFVYTSDPGPYPKSPHPPYLSPEELTAYEALKRCPAWWDVRLDDSSSTRELLRCMDELNHYETDTLRNAIVALIAADDSIENQSRVFVLIRYIFDLPPQPKIENFSYHGGWGIPEDRHNIDLQWPLGVRDDGQLEMVGQPCGYYGGVYQPLEDFDLFSDHFPRRKPHPVETTTAQVPGSESSAAR